MATHWWSRRRASTTAPGSIWQATLIPNSFALRRDSAESIFGHIQRQIIFEDPQTLTKPLTFSLALSYAPDTEILENICEDRDSPHLVGRANTGPELSSASLARHVGTYEFRGVPQNVAGSRAAPKPLP